MFRQEESFAADWHENTIEAMQRRRFDRIKSQLPQLGAERIERMSFSALRHRLEHAWIDVPRKPFRAQQEEQILKTLLGTMQMQADCLSHDEHELVERALILGGCAKLDDAAELDAAKALSLRLWGHVGLVSGTPYLELENAVLRHVTKALSSEEHEKKRERFSKFHAYMNGWLYRMGAVDDRLPQRIIMRNVLGMENSGEETLQLARRYLWASYDCVDYSEGVLLIHSALVDPMHLMRNIRRKSGIQMLKEGWMNELPDILPEEVPLQRELERALNGALRNGFREQDVARTLRLLCKQGAPMRAMEEVLQASLIVRITDSMRRALFDMYLMMPKWVECEELSVAQ